MEDKMRENFETWASNFGYDLAIYTRDNTYSSSKTQNLWFCWQSCASEMCKEAKALVEELQPYLWHKNQCDYVTSFTKDCTCGYPKILTKAQAWLEGK